MLLRIACWLPLLLLTAWSERLPVSSVRRVTRSKDGGAEPAAAKPNELTVRRGGDLTIVRYGTPGSASMRVDIECGKGDTKLLDVVRKHGEPIEAGVPDQALLRRLTEFGARDAVLPPGLAELRR